MWQGSVGSIGIVITIEDCIACMHTYGDCKHQYNNDCDDDYVVMMMEDYQYVSECD